MPKAIPYILTGAGGFFSAKGAMQEGAALAGASKYNAASAEQNAVYARQVAAENERRQRVLLAQEMGSITANQGKSGTFGGSNLAVLATSAANAELEALTIRHEGEVEARRFEEEAKLNKLQAKEAKKAGKMGALSSLLGAGAEIFSMTQS